MAIKLFLPLFIKVVIITAVLKGIWHATQKLILLVGLSLKGITQGGGGQGGAHKVRGWGKSMLPAGSMETYTGWSEDGRGDVPLGVCPQ